MNLVNLFLISSAFFAIGMCFLNDPDLFKDNPKLCSELNTSMFESIEEILENTEKLEKSYIEEDQMETITETVEETTFSESQLRSKRSTKLNVTLNFTNFHKKPLMFPIIVPEGHTLLTLKNLKFPNVENPAKFSVKVFKFQKSDLNYVYIVGERCKYQYNESSETYQRFSCWTKPSFCRGSLETCLLNDDGDFLCYDEISGEGEKTKPNPNDVLPNMAGKILFEPWGGDEFIVKDNGDTDFISFGYTWYCNEIENISANCESFGWAGFAWAVKSLKTLSGYGG